LNRLNVLKFTNLQSKLGPFHGSITHIEALFHGVDGEQTVNKGVHE